MLKCLLWACCILILHCSTLALVTSWTEDNIKEEEEKFEQPTFKNLKPGCSPDASGLLEPWLYIGIKSVSLPSEVGFPTRKKSEPDKENVGTDVAVPVMKSGGGYGKHASSQLAYLHLMMPTIMKGVKEDAVIFDLGSADGMNSREMLRTIKSNTSRFTIALVDLPANDWKTTRTVLKPLVDKVYPDNELMTDQLVNPQNIDRESKYNSKAVLIGRSFYERVAADASVNIFFSGTAVQYLSSSAPFEEGDRAAQDWLTFLRHRSKELVPGGSLHVTGLSGHIAGVKSGYVWTVLNATLDKAVYMHMLTLQDRLNFRWIGYPRTEFEWKEPFENNQVPTLKLESFKIVQMDTPYWSQADGDACRFVELYVPSVMAWISSYLAHRLGETVLQLFHENLRTAVAKQPSRFRHDFYQAMMHIRKINHTIPAHAKKNV